MVTRRTLTSPTVPTVGGKFDIWVQQVSGGDPVQITKGPGHDWQPDWSPDGKYIAYRSEEGDGGIYVIPALGGAGLERKIAPFGYYPSGHPIARRCCSRPTLVRSTLAIGSSSRSLMAARPAKFWPSSLHRTNCAAFSRMVSGWKENHGLGRRFPHQLPLLDRADCWRARYQAGDCARDPERTRTGFRRR